MIVNLLLMQFGYPPALHITTPCLILRDTGMLPSARWEESFVALTAAAVETMFDQYLEILLITEHADKYLRMKPQALRLLIEAEA
jgi:hypothetical protein